MCEVTPPDFYIYIIYVYIKYYIQGRQSFVPFPRVTRMQARQGHEVGMEGGEGMV